MGKKAVIVVDMLNDFVTGSLACDRGKAIVPALAKLVEAARKNGVPVIYSNDSHLKGIDAELKLWGDHAIRGTAGAEIIPELAAKENDFVVNKRRYSGFFETDLNLLLSELGADTVIVTGLHAHMCVRHTAADAYFRGYDIVIPQDATDSFTEEDYTSGIKYLKDVYGAKITTTGEIIASKFKD
jgi:nicotinamidase-related amidase